jgi:hypothetical protein
VIEKIKIRHFPKAVLVCVLAGFLSFSFADRENPPDRYYAQRGLGGLKVKVANDFTLGCWSAIYIGNSYFPNRFTFKPFQYQGFDVVPGFVVDVGNIIGKTKLSLGADYYYLWRNWEYDFEASVRQDRARASLIFNTPFAGNFKLTINQMFERIKHQRWARKTDSAGNYYGSFTERSGPTLSYFRFRTNFKVTGPAFSSLKISPYASYEGYNFRPAPKILPSDPFYLEAEFGIATNPAKGWNINLADQIQTTPERRGWETHQISLYMFYTFDFSEYFSTTKTPG